MKCTGQVTYAERKGPISGATVVLVKREAKQRDVEVTRTRADENGNYVLREVPPGKYFLQCKHFGQEQEVAVEVIERRECNASIDLAFDTGIIFKSEGDDGRKDGGRKTVEVATVGKRIYAVAEPGLPIAYDWKVYPYVPFVQTKNEIEFIVPPGIPHLRVEVLLIEEGHEVAVIIKLVAEIPVRASEVTSIDGRVSVQESVGVRLLRSESFPTLDQALWVAIRNRTRAISFGRYQDFMNRALCWEEREFQVPGGLDPVTQDRIQRDIDELGTHLRGVRAYQLLKMLTETFLLLETGVRIESERGRNGVPLDPGEEVWRLGRRFTSEELEQRLTEYLGDRRELPYITRVVRAMFPQLGGDGWEGRLIASRIDQPILIELIWSYWMEEGMLVQTMNALTRRFQNVRGGEDRDPLANVEIDPLRPLNNLLWGFIQDEYNRLTVRRRAYEYIHHYGLPLYGKAAANLNPADRRSKFLEAFHNLLFQASIFFKDDFQTTVIADGFPLLNSLKEVHLILAQALHNQAGDVPYTARAEMMLMQYMLARREVRDFLQSRAMVPYKEPWEGQVDAMKTMQGWTDTTVSFFGDLAVYGEQLLLSIRYGDWIGVNNEDSAKNWARYFRPEIQGYLHAYRAVTGIDLTNPDTVDSTIPGFLLQKRVAMQRPAR